MTTAIEHSENPLADTLVNRRNAGIRGQFDRYDPGRIDPLRNRFGVVRRMAEAHDVRIEALDDANAKVAELRAILEQPVPEAPTLDVPDLAKAIKTAARLRSVHAETWAMAGELLEQAEAQADALVSTELAPAVIGRLVELSTRALAELRDLFGIVPDVPSTELARLNVAQFEAHGRLQHAVSVLEQLVENRKAMASFVGEPSSIADETLRKWAVTPVLVSELASPPKDSKELIRRYPELFADMLGLRDLEPVAKWRKLVDMERSGVLTLGLATYGGCSARVALALRWPQARFALHNANAQYM
jgi:hypothetical protein